MKNGILSCIVLLLCSFYSEAQSVYFTRTGKVEFHAGTTLEDIDAVNNEVTSVLDIQKGSLAFQVLIKSFHFRRALMEEHFNENYMESSKYPKATFNGKVNNIEQINFSADGTYSANVEGTLSMHGISKLVTATATIFVKNKKVSAICNFILKTDDYNIKIPTVVADKISKDVNISIQCQYDPRN
ncbi:YceI family protein [Pollutibacter soli]|uniref:YceI family protein n=1 Tax=Pollutibacter soli TaxID=3034157 RepID=UPI0030138607